MKQARGVDSLFVIICGLIIFKLMINGHGTWYFLWADGFLKHLLTMINLLIR